LNFSIPVATAQRAITIEMKDKNLFLIFID